MKKRVVLLLAVLMLLSLCACGGEAEGDSGEITRVSAYKSEGEYTDLGADKLSWEGINSVPIKTAGMDITEARQICVDFFRYAKTALWIPDEDYDIWGNAQLNQPEPPDRSLTGGVTYGSLPYISWARGTIYRLMDYIDEETGVVDVSRAGAVPMNFGNQCANGAYVGFARVINSADYGVTGNMVAKDGFLRLGDYYYQDYLTGYSLEYGTPHIINENGNEVMMESYAKLKAGDGIVYWTTAGHVVMIATDAVVERTADGKIDPAKSYVTIIDQATKFLSATSPSGIPYEYEENVDAKWTFQKLLSGKYLPFTFAEWLGTDPIEETEISFSHTGETISKDELFKAKVTCNYNIFDLYAIFTDSKGNEVCKLAARPLKANVREMQFSKAGEAFEMWGDYEDLDPKKDYKVQIVAQLGTGERPTLWEGKWAAK